MSEPSTSNANDKRSGTFRWKGSTILVVAVTIAIVAIPLLVIGLPIEISRWYLANALARLEADDATGATTSLQQAANFAPTDTQVFLIQAQVFRSLEQHEQSLKAADRALELTTDKRGAQRQRGATLMQMQQFSRAAAAFEAALDPNWSFHNGPGDNPLNTLAYARALAGEKLPAALEEINQALDQQSADNELGRAAMLDTRGLILHKLGKHQAALSDLDEAISLSNLRRVEHFLNTLKLRSPGIEIEGYLEDSKTNLAVMHYHRALIHESLEQTDKAAADLAKVRELGHEPSEALF